MPFCICTVKRFWGEKRRVPLWKPRCGGRAAHSRSSRCLSSSRVKQSVPHAALTLAQCLQGIYAGRGSQDPCQDCAVREDNAGAKCAVCILILMKLLCDIKHYVAALKPHMLCQQDG